MPTLPTDQPARDAIRTRLETTMLVEAAAGTGKTTSLVARMVSLVRAGVARSSNIAAITFTIKAAGQLRERFHEELELALKQTASGPERQRLAVGLAEIDRGFIGTTHAFCGRLLHERPVEAGLDPEFEEIDEVAMRFLTREFWARWYEAQSIRRPELLAEARAVNLDARGLRNAFEIVAGNPDVTLISERTPAPDLGGVCRAICDFLDECEPHLPQSGDEPDAFVLMMVKLLRLRDSLDLEDLAAQLQFLDEADHASAKPVQRRWPDKGQAKRLGEKYAELVRTALRPTLQLWYEHVHGIAADLLRAAGAEFAAERRVNATLSFHDLLVCARDLLRDNAHVRRYFQRRFTHLLVDEFQDTDPLQAEVVFYLTGADVEERNWRKLVPRAGSLFIVGDPKQAIYRFRRADITTYLTVKRRIEETGGEVLQLVTNFRSAPQVCAFVNGAFRQLFVPAEVDAGRQAPHVELAHYHEPAPPVGVFTLETQSAKNDVMAEAEAGAVARWIRAAVDSGRTIDDLGTERPARWGDFLLVSWQRPRLTYYAAALERLGVPYSVTGSRAFSGADELAALIPLLRAIVDPEDAVSVVAFLRGPLCGTDDDALYRFRQNRGSFSPFAEPPEGSDERIVKGMRVLSESIDDARALPPAAAIARIFERTGVVPLAASRERPGTRSGTLLLALAMAREESARGEPLASIVEQWTELIATQSDVEELDVDPARENAVRVMNLHQVKGLEAPVVFLIDPANEFDFPIDLVVDRSGEESRGHLAVMKEWGKGRKAVALPQRWEELLANETLFVDAEKRRLLYVAATRAKNVLVAGFRQSKDGFAGAWRELARRIPDRLFAMPDAMQPEPAAVAITRRFEDGRAERAERHARAGDASYSVLPVTKVVHADHAQLVRAEEGLGRGTSWGRVLHRLFEAMLRDDRLDVRRHAANLLKDEERDPVELEDVIRAVEALRSSKLWQRVKKATERYAEVPFALMVPRRDVGIDEDGDTLLHGTVDLVFREGNRWTVVDYKSDRTAGRLESLIAFYAPQVRHYARFWQQLTNTPTAAALFFVDGGIVQEV